MKKIMLILSLAIFASLSFTSCCPESCQAEQVSLPSLAAGQAYLEVETDQFKVYSVRINSNNYLVTVSYNGSVSMMLE